MADVLKARVHLVVILDLAEVAPFSFRTEALVATRDPEWAEDQARVHARYSLDAVGIRGYEVNLISIEWIELRCD